MDGYKVGKLLRREIAVKVPASKSILNRALLLAAFTNGDTFLECGTFGDDTLSLLSCLDSLGIVVDRSENGLLVHGKRDFAAQGTLNVGSAGTVARFLTAILALRGGDYTLNASEQMAKRPMEILSLLASLGVKVDYFGESEHFPFRLRSEGVLGEKFRVDTDVSTQYASGLMIAAALGDSPKEVELTGNRTDGSYLAMTASLIRAFGGDCRPLDLKSGFLVTPIGEAPSFYAVEPDLSGACYFYAIALLCNAVVTVRGVHRKTLQGDLRFLDLLRSKGVHFKETEEGIRADGRYIPFYNGIDEKMRDFSDQTMTAAVLAAFASSPSILRDIAHIRTQECDRVEAILENLNRLGARAFTNGEDIFIEPGPVRPCTIKAFGDHRIAMAFALAGLKTGEVTVDDPDCCRKTFPNYFELLSTLTQ